MKIIKYGLMMLLIMSLLYGCNPTDIPVKETYTVSFMTNGGNNINNIIVEEGSIITLPNTPVRAGYTFDGWFLDNFIFSEPADIKLSEPVTEDFKVYSKWLLGSSDNPRILITLSDSRQIRLELYPDVAPITVSNFLSLIDEGYYTNTIFHRIKSNFMIQAGMLETDGNSYKYKPSRSPIVGEFTNNGHYNNLSHTLGVISMARTIVEDSASTQFFICSGTSEHLDGNYAAFGKTLDAESNQVVLSLSYLTTQTYDDMQDFPFTAQGGYVVISSITRLD